MTTIQVHACQDALRKMFEGSHFSICTIDNILRVTRGVPDRADYDTLRLLHCVDWREMSPETRAALPGLIQRVLRAPAIMWQHALPLNVETIDLNNILKTSRQRLLKSA